MPVGRCCGWCEPAILIALSLTTLAVAQDTDQWSEIPTLSEKANCVRAVKETWGNSLSNRVSGQERAKFKSQ
ncbi:hypothetical protein scyTo_0008620 [Scyliorhinus torazame]|uniref:Uncharacterized protein n=1 Tax=Scyliorhinus torazame TaxID=75743 RepID=A0A401PBT9_SCYTO|nr:hypothetical protein [Scyliorhinus torazame]